jgi:hypothetical protein
VDLGCAPAPGANPAAGHAGVSPPGAPHTLCRQEANARGQLSGWISRLSPGLILAWGRGAQMVLKNFVLEVSGG